MAGPNKGHHPFAAPQGAKQPARKVGGSNGHTHDIAPIAKPRGPSTAVKIAQNAVQGEKPHSVTKVAGVVHNYKNVRTP